MAAPTNDRVAVLDDLLTERSSCRAFLETPVPAEVLDRLLTMAQRSPSWCNTQPWHLTVVEGSALETLRTEFVEHARSQTEKPDFPFPTEYTGQFLERRRECAWQLYDSVGIAQAALASHAPFLREHLDIPEHRKIVLGISFGYADTDHQANAFRTNRADIAIAARVIS